MDVPYYKADGSENGTYSIDENLFGEKIRWKMLKSVVQQYEQARRRGTRSAKTRSEVRGTSKKPWRQKGTGRARVGTRRNPVWRGGGTAKTIKNQNWDNHVPKRMRRGALDSALLGKLRDGEVAVVENWSMDAPKTKVVATALDSMNRAKSTLVVHGEHDRTLHLSTRNIPHIALMTAAELNAYDVLRYTNLVFTASGAEALVASRKGE